MKKYVKTDKEKFEDYKKEVELGILEIHKMSELKELLKANRIELKENDEDTTEEDYLLSMISKNENKFSHIVIKLNNAMEFIILDFLNIKGDE